MENKIPNSVVQNYIKGNYRVVGKYKHTSMKPCHWLEQKLQTGRMNRNCYKGYWGVKSETCIQNSPSYPYCTHNCVFCWRLPENNLGYEFNCKPDEPSLLVDELILHHKNLINYAFKISENLQNYFLMQLILNYVWQSIKDESNINYNYNNILPEEKSDLEEESEELSEGFYQKSPFTFNKFLNKLKREFEGLTINKLEKALKLLRNTGVLHAIKPDLYFITMNALKELINHQDILKLLDKFVTNESDIKKVYENAMNPSHAAISLEGEPTLYPYIGELVSEFRKRRFTTFIVSNGTNPNAIQNMSDNNNLPTILYITLPTPDYNSYIKIFRPRLKDNWDNIKKTLNLLRDLKCRTVLRITCVNELTLKDEFIKEYVNIINQAKPNFVDLKSFTVEAGAVDINKRLGTTQSSSFYVPSYKRLKDFALKICNLGGFEIIKEHIPSRDILIQVRWPKNKSIIIQENEK